MAQASLWHIASCKNVSDKGEREDLQLELLTGVSYSPNVLELPARCMLQDSTH